MARDTTAPAAVGAFDDTPLRRTPWVTYGLIAANVVVLLLTPEAYLPLRAVGLHFHASMEGAAAAGRACDIIETAPSSASVTT